MVALGLHFSLVVHGLLIVVTCCRARALGTRASVVIAHRLSCHKAFGIFGEQGLNPCSLHWQENS